MPLLVLGIGILFIIVAIGVLKIHPFIALILAAILVGLLSPVPLTSGAEVRQQIEEARLQLEAERDRIGMSPDEFSTRWQQLRWEAQQRWLSDQGRKGGQAALALELTATEFGSTAAAIGIVIALAAIIGQCLMESGAADKITRFFLRLLGEKRAPVALFSSGYLLSVPVFFDTVFFLLVPLARALRMRTGKNYVLYVMAISGGAVVTHSLVPPTPGPLLMAETIPGLSLGSAIGLGLLLSLIPGTLGGILFAVYLGRRFPVPLREAAGVSLKELEGIVRRPETQLPGLFVSLLPVLLPVALITGDTILQSLAESGAAGIPAGLLEFSAFVGNKNFALLTATFLAVLLLKQQQKLSLSALRERLEPPLLSAGVIILITSAGGAFGKMLARTGISETLQQGTSLFADQGLLFILLAFGLASIMKIAQGSGTVSMITASAMMAALIGDVESLPYHPIYIFAAVGFGSLVISWMNDSGFWVVCKMSGFTEKETLSTWTLVLLVIGVLGLIQVLILSLLLPLK